MNKFKISLNPKLTAFIDLIINVALLLSLQILSTWLLFLLVFILRQLLWLLLIKFTYYPRADIRWKHYFSLLVFGLGTYLTIIFIDWNVALYSLFIVFIILTFVSFWFLPSSKIQFNIFLKPYTRWRFILSSLGVAGILTGIQSIMFYQVLFVVNNWTWYLLSSILSTAIATWWWYEYKIKFKTKTFIAIGIFFLIMTEIVWVVSKLPIGNIVSGLLLAWSWYVAWLFNRFNLTEEGIDWKKQTRFLVINLILLILFLIFIARWK